MFALPIKNIWDSQLRGKYWFHSFEFLEKNVLLEIFRNLICQLTVAFKNPEKILHFSWNKTPESAAEYFTAFSDYVRNTSYHKNLHYPYLGMVNIRKIK
jgi:hypothetical protein